MTRPRWIAPELATLVEEAPTGPGWVHEVKYDGYRIIAVVHAGRARLLTRGRQDWTRRFPTIATAAAALPVESAVLDGELVALDTRGRSRFQLLQQSLEEGAHHRLRYAVFDLLEVDGDDLRRLPLQSRRQRLMRLLRHSGPIFASRQFRGGGAAALRTACRAGMEGIVSKRRDARYRSTRTRDWVKVKCGHRQEFVVAGFTDPRGSRHGFGALLLGVHDTRGRLHYAGRVGTGFNRDRLRALHQHLRRIERTRSPLVDGPAHAHWVRPTMVVEVRFTEWTAEGRLRHPSFIAVRSDKRAADVVREGR